MEPEQSPPPEQPTSPAPSAPREPAPSSTPEPVSTQNTASPADSVEPVAPLPTPLSPRIPTAKRWYRWLWLPILVLIVAAGLFVVSRYGQTKQAPAVAVHKDIPLLKIATLEPLPHSFYPDIDDSSINGDVDSQAFEGLTGFEDQTKIVPRLAVSWTNPDSSTWVFKLRPDVKFHTGRTMTAADVKSSLENIQNFSLGPEFGSTIDKVSVVDPLTVKITTKAPDPILPNELTNLYIYDTTSKTLNSPLNGTGPYTVGSTQAPKDTIELAAFDSYWGGQPHVRAVQFASLSNDSEVLKAIQHKTYDIIQAHTTANTKAGEKLGYHYYDVIVPQTAHLMLNSRRPDSPLAKVAVRKALMQAIDPNALLKARNLTGVPISQIVPPEIPGYDPSVVRPPYDPAAAKAALTAAGYPHGFTITFTYYVGAQDLADAVSKEFSAIGVTVKQDPESDLNVLGTKALGGGTDMFYITLSSSVVDASDIFSSQGEFVDSANYDNPQVDQLFTQMGSTLDSNKRLAIMQHISRLLVEDRADLPLYATPDNNWLVKPNIVLNQAMYGGDVCIRVFETYGT